MRTFIVEEDIGDWEPSQLLCVAETLEQAIKICDRHPSNYKFFIREASEAGVHAEYAYNKKDGLENMSDIDILVEDSLKEMAEEGLL